MHSKKPLPTGSASSSDLVKKSWDTLASCQKFEPSWVRPVIAASWQRCLAQKIHPCQSVPLPGLITDEIAHNNSQLVETALPHMRQLHTLLGKNDYLLMLLCKEGFIVSLSGDRKILAQAERLNVFPGAMQSEKSIGTFAPGICLENGEAVQVLQYEHYREAYHGWYCSAAPIKDCRQQVIGVLDVTSIGKTPHPARLLDVVSLTACTIEAELRLKLLQGAYGNLCCHFNALVENTSDALLVFDKSDTITHASPEAQRLLRSKATELVGKNANTLISGYSSAKQAARNDESNTRVSLAQAGGAGIKANLRLVSPASEGLQGVIQVLGKTLEHAGKNPELRYMFSDIISKNATMCSLLDDARNMVNTKHTVLIQGESGTGKEMLAQAIHQESSRTGGPFVAVNCAALAKELIQSELFGYAGGSFTGAHAQGHRGKFEQADGGTIFLDEIGDMPLEAQVNLLRVVQEKNIVRVGGTRPKPLDVRIIAATNKPLFQSVEKGLFRQDLYYRLSVLCLHIPPLRERHEDIEALLEHFMHKHSEAGRQDLPHISGDVWSALMEYPWPGNARELENAAIYFLNKIKGHTVTLKDLPPSLLTAPHLLKKKDDLRKVERQAIFAALAECGGRMSETAKTLGISRVTLYRKLKNYKQADDS